MPKNNRRNNRKKENNENVEDNKFSFDEEIVIGLKRIDAPEEINKKLQKKKMRKKIEQNKRKRINKRTKEKKDNFEIKHKQVNQDYQNINENKIVKDRKTNKKSKINKRRKLILKVIKYLTLVSIIIGGIIYAMLSPMFNIKNISVEGNLKVPSETIISLSGLMIDQNIFNFRTSDIINSIKENAYIDEVEISRKLPEQVNIKVTERENTFLLAFGNAYAYINNQGYILEINREKKDLPILSGYKTSKEEIQAGNRLCIEDLERLEEILKIIEVTENINTSISKMITNIDIADKTNYILTLEKEKKKVYLGDLTSLSTKILWIDEFLKSEKGKEGIICLNVNLNNEEPYFREKV